MLIPMRSILQDAMARGYAVAAPNVYDSDSVGACFEAAFELRAPLIIGVGSGFDLDLIGCVARHYASKHPEVPVALNLDHGKTFDAAVKAIRAGFTSVMVDRSQDPLEENVRETIEIVKMARAAGVSVEGEVGHVGRGADYETGRDAGLTSVEDAVEYWKRTQVDCLATAVGTAHGKYAGIPRIDFDRLSAIRRAVDVPLVLHVGSSTGDENLTRAVRLGISKVNVATDLFASGGAKVRECLEASPDSTVRAIAAAGRSGYKSELKRYIRLLGAENRW